MSMAINAEMWACVRFLLSRRIKKSEKGRTLEAFHCWKRRKKLFLHIEQYLVIVQGCVDAAVLFFKRTF